MLLHLAFSTSNVTSACPRASNRLAHAESSLLDLCESSLRRGHANILCIFFVTLLVDSLRGSSVKNGSMPRAHFEGTSKACPDRGRRQREVGRMRLEASSRLVGSKQNTMGLNSLACAFKNKQSGTVSSNSRFQTVRFQQYSANLSDKQFWRRSSARFPPETPMRVAAKSETPPGMYARTLVHHAWCEGSSMARCG